MKPITDQQSLQEALLSIGFEPVHPNPEGSMKLMFRATKGVIRVERGTSFFPPYEKRPGLFISFNMDPEVGSDFSAENAAMYEFLTDEGVFVFAYARVLALRASYH